MVFDYVVFNSCYYPEGLFTRNENSPVTDNRTDIILHWSTWALLISVRLLN